MKRKSLHTSQVAYQTRAVVHMRPPAIPSSHDNHKKINSWVSFAFLYGYGAPLGGPLGRRSSAMILVKDAHFVTCGKYVKQGETEKH